MSALFPSLLNEVLFWVVFVGVFVVGHFLAILKAGGERQPVRKKETEPLVAMLSLFLFGIIVIPILVGYARLGMLQSYLFYPGLVIMILGFTIVKLPFSTELARVKTSLLTSVTPIFPLEDQTHSLHYPLSLPRISSLVPSS